MRVDGGVVLLDEELDEGGETLLGRVVQAGPAHFCLAVDEGVPGEQSLANLDAAVLRRQVERGLALVVENVDSTVVLKEYLQE